MKLHQDSLQAIEQIRTLAAPGQKISFVGGHFNILHPGHLRLLRFAKECSDLLVVGVYDQTQSGAILSEEVRLEALSSNSWVDFAFVLRDPVPLFLQTLQPDLVIKGKEHERVFNPEQEVVERYGGKLLFSSGDSRFSSLNLLRNEFFNGHLSTIQKPLDYPVRHGFCLEELSELLDAIPTLRTLVVGDTIVDEYITCDALGMSQEDPTLVVTPLLKKKFIGGAAIVAAHARSLGAQVRLFSLVGHDAEARFAREQLAHYGVETHFLEDESRPTTLKQRYRAAGKTLLRVNTLRQHSLTHVQINHFLQAMQQALTDADLLIFSDFNYGCLPQALIEPLSQMARDRGIMLCADSQCSSQIGDIARFKGMDLLTPTEREARLAMRDHESGLVILAEALRRQTGGKHVILTLGPEGVLIHAQHGASWETDRLPAFNQAPKDLAGAGDAFFICTSMGMALGRDIWQSAYFGSLAAACQVGRVGNIPLTREELQLDLSMAL